jgi:hypothetical protein
MHKLRTALLAGAGAILVAGAAVAAEKYDHVMKVALPDGSVAQIHYQGKVAPQVVVSDAPVRHIIFADPFEVFADPGFADLNRMAAAMEQEHQQMMQRIAQMQAQMADALKAGQSETRTVSATNGAAPTGNVVRYSFVSTTNSDGCTTSVQWSSDGSSAQTKVYKTSSGSCGEKAEEAKPQKAAAPKSAEPKAIPGANRT